MPSITPEVRVHTLTVLELRPSRLVGTSLAPEKPLQGEKKVAAFDGGGKSSDNGENESPDKLEAVSSCDTNSQDHHREGPNTIPSRRARHGEP